MSYLFTDSASYLLNRIGLKLSDRFGKQLAEFGVTVPIYRVIATLLQHGDQTLGELQELVSIEMSTLSRLVGQLVKQGLVSRIRPEENARIVRIDLTPKGQDLAQTLTRLGAAFEASVLDGLDPGDVAGFKARLRLINQNVEPL